MTILLKLAVALFIAVGSTGLVDQVTASGRCVALVETPDLRVAERLAIAPGQAPLFSFRLYEGQARQRFSNSDLMMDDAGH